MIATNPATASWLRELNLDAAGLWISRVLLLAIPMSLGLRIARQLPKLTAKIQKPLANFSLTARLAFIVVGVVKERQRLTFGLLPTLAIVIVHNVCGLFFGWITSLAMGVTERDRRVVMIGRHAKRRPRARHHRAAVQCRPRHGHHRKAMGHLAHH